MFHPPPASVRVVDRSPQKKSFSGVFWPLSTDWLFCEVCPPMQTCRPYSGNAWKRPILLMDPERVAKSSRTGLTTETSRVNDRVCSWCTARTYRLDLQRRCTVPRGTLLPAHEYRRVLQPTELKRPTEKDLPSDRGRRNNCFSCREAEHLFNGVLFASSCLTGWITGCISRDAVTLSPSARMTLSLCSCTTIPASSTFEKWN